MQDVIGIDLGGTKIAGIRMDAAGAVREEQRIASPRDDYRATLAAIAELVTGLEGGDSPLPVGIGTPGSLRPGTQLMQNCNSVWLNDRPLKHDLEVQLGRTVRMANDADCFAVSEARDGAGAGHASVFGVILGTGVGGGWVVQGQLLQGPNALSGEWGHMRMPAARSGEDGTLADLETNLQTRLCYCGAHDCVETWLSGPGLARTHEGLTREQRSAADIATADTEPCRTTMALYISMLGRALAQVINAVDPHVVVLGGGLSNVVRIYDEIGAHLAQHVFAGRCRTEVVPPRWGDASGVRGAAGLCLSVPVH